MSAEFRQRHMRVIELNENDVASQIRMNHGRELEVVDAALDQILQGLDAFAYVKQRPDSRLEDAQMFLAVRSFNSLHIARQLLEHGYYQQASALVRMAMEDQLVAEDAETHPPTFVKGGVILGHGVSTSSDYVRVMDQRLCQWLLCQANSYPVR